jgi:hypothetical protein
VSFFLTQGFRGEVSKVPEPSGRGVRPERQVNGKMAIAVTELTTAPAVLALAQRMALTLSALEASVPELPRTSPTARAKFPNLKFPEKK